MAIIYSSALGSGNDQGYGGFNERVIIPKASLSAGPSGQIRVTVKFASTATSASTLDSLWIGTQAAAGNAYNYAGDQVQLKFSGSSSLTLGSLLIQASDWTGFAYQGNGSNLVVALHFTGATADGLYQVGAAGASFFISAADSGGTTAPAGTWTSNNRLTFVLEIDTEWEGSLDPFWEPRKYETASQHYNRLGFDTPPRSFAAATATPGPLLPPPFWDNRLKWSLWARRDFDQPEFWRNRGILVPTTMPPEPFWDPVKPYETAKQHLSRLGFEPPPWRNLGILVPTTKPSEPWFDPPIRWKAPPGFEHPAIPPFGTTVPTSVLPPQWFDPPIRWKAPPGFVEQPPQFFGIKVPTAAPQSEWWQAVKQPSRQTIWNTDVLQPFAAAVVTPSFVPNDWWSAARRSYSTLSWDGNVVPLAVLTPSPVPLEWWTASRAPYRVQIWDANQAPQPFGIAVPTVKPSEPWFDPPKRWVAPPGFEAPPWRNLGILVPTSKPSEPWFDPPKRWVAPPGFDPTWTRPFGTQVPTYILPPEWWAAVRRLPAVSTWSPDVFRPLVAAVVTPSFVSAEWWAISRRSPVITSWDGVVPSSPSIPILIGSEWWIGAPNARRRAEWWDFLPTRSALVPFMDQAWWGLTTRGRAAEWWRDSPLAPPVGVLGGWQASFFDPRVSLRQAGQDWALGSFFALTGTATFIPPQQIVYATAEPFIVKAGTASSTVYAVDIVNIVKKV